MKAPASSKGYVIVWASLLGLLLLTWGLANLNLGPMNVAVALVIALAKMLLVVLFFMHVRSSSPVTWLFVAAGFIWFVIMVELTLSDYLTRSSSMRPAPALEAVAHPPSSLPFQVPPQHDTP